ncbi:CAP domain-containing protein [uncultured Mameliella sp.]|uniref:CAP domain-containing protein n=1 Tax=uncultured Mameliella sp. TaxID=1447087 RepID=UPI002603D1B5|nr:CAP domain-containing protein [uncultured Mameliella sp.]
MLDLINADRAALGRAPLMLELNLKTSAQAHSVWMVAADVFSHTGAGGSSATQRMLAAGMEISGSWRSAENIDAVSVSGADSYCDEVAQLHANLMNSPGHYANLMDPDLVVIGEGGPTRTPWRWVA